MYDVVIIGGGIIGLATGYKLLRKRPDTKLLILEKEPELAFHQTGHNSGVIHSGIYYKPGSLKASICRRGVSELISFCDEHQIPYDLCGKVVVATSEEEVPALNKLYERGIANGVPDLRIIDPNELEGLEPHAKGVQALHSPTTGIICFRSVSEKCAENILQKGGAILTNAEVFRLVIRSGKCLVVTTRDNYEASLVINCAGLFSDRVAAMSGVSPDLKIIPFRGEYYALKPESRHLVKNMIYPVPDPRFPFLGVHFTRGMDGSIEAGPNAVLALAREGYRKSQVNFGDLWEMASYLGFWRMAKKHWAQGFQEVYRSLSKPAFVNTLRKLVPAVASSDLLPGGAGVRAMALHRDGDLLDDFWITRKGMVINVLNAPSPAATGSFAIADHIVELAYN